MTQHLVVGINGTIGSHLFARLQSTEIGVWGTTHRPQHTQRERVFHLNLLDPPSTWNFPPVKFDVAYLCAGICRMALCEEDPVGTAKTNIDGMAALARRLAEDGTFIVYLSTNQVFFGDKPFALPNAPYQPLNEYGRQKAHVEQLIKTHSQHWAIVRLTKVVEQNMVLIKNWLESFVDRKTIEAFHDMMLAPVSLREVIDILIKIGQKKQTGCYQVSGEQDISYFDLANYLISYLKYPESLVIPVSAIDKGIKKIFLPQFTTLDCSSTIALCGGKPPHFSAVVHECFDITVQTKSAV